MDIEKLFKDALASENMSKVKRIGNDMLPDHLQNTLFSDMFKANQLLSITEKRYKKEMENAGNNLLAILFFEFLRIDDQLIAVNPDNKDQWSKDPLVLDKVFHERCKSFYDSYSKLIDLDPKSFLQEAMFHYYFMGNEVPEISKHRFLNILLLAKAGLIKEHFNRMIEFYKEYKHFTSVTIALKELVKTYELALKSSSQQLSLLTTPLIRHKFGISKKTADAYTANLLLFFKEKLSILDPEYFHVQERVEIYIDELSQFQQVKNIAPESVKNDLPVNASEDEIQKVLEKIIGENFHQVDWGGEINDIFSSFFTQSGKRYNAAFLLKGSGTKGKLTIKKCGKNGDQLFKLSLSNADFFFVQHVDAISQEVRQDFLSKIQLIKIKEKKAVRCCFIDGTDTARILKAYS